jgi:type II secretory pathway pseudopilin PulG
MPARKSGFTILELMIYTGILAILGAPIVSLILSGTRSLEESNDFNTAIERNRAILTRIQREARRAIATTLAVSNGGRTLVFTEAAGFDGVSIVPGDTIQYDLVLFTGEVANGADDNGNGLIDEGQVVRRNLSTGESVVVSAPIDLAGSSFALNGRTVMTTLTHQSFLGKAQASVSVQRQVQILARN